MVEAMPTVRTPWRAIAAAPVCEPLPPMTTSASMRSRRTRSAAARWSLADPAALRAWLAQWIESAPDRVPAT